MTNMSRDGTEPPGKCMYCGWECNPASQACGVCMRDANMYSLGMKKNVPEHIKEKTIPPLRIKDIATWRKVKIIDFKKQDEIKD
jgi:hypothetical protein